MEILEEKTNMVFVQVSYCSFKRIIKLDQS